MASTTSVCTSRVGIRQASNRAYTMVQAGHVRRGILLINREPFPDPCSLIRDQFPGLISPKSWDKVLEFFFNMHVHGVPEKDSSKTICNVKTHAFFPGQPKASDPSVWGICKSHGIINIDVLSSGPDFQKTTFFVMQNPKNHLLKTHWVNGGLFFDVYD